MDHLQGQGWRQGCKNPVIVPRSIDEILQKDTITSSHKLKNRLFLNGLKSKICEIYGLSEWMGKPIPLELDHINGVNSDNRLENLRILCPNCHAQTTTYRGKKLAKCRDETAPS
jgi:5-methylcytosine-specific restriction endonuclease McrA